MAKGRANITATWPILDGKIHPDASQAIRLLRDDIKALHTRVSGVEKSKVDTAQFPAELKKHAAVTRSTLQTGGEAPLNANSLFGSLAQGQLTNVPSVPTLPKRNDSLSKNGTLIVQGGTLYRYDGTTHAWVAV